MPLSEEEQRVLREIERSFYENDPDFAHDVGSRTIWKDAGRNVKWGVVGFVVGLAFLLATFASVHPILGFVGFLVMLGCTFVIERNLRRMGKAGLRSFSDTMRARGVTDVLGDTRRRLRDRFNREG
ncbi:MAG TPA: DUF3040 domain-containing protein [Acidimicrobiales bacterium]|nr:DUF3040 domain-containing protein [Acidimicrobiales bacterium]